MSRAKLCDEPFPRKLIAIFVMTEIEVGFFPTTKQCSIHRLYSGGSLGQGTCRQTDTTSRLRVHLFKIICKGRIMYTCVVAVCNWPSFAHRLQGVHQRITPSSSSSSSFHPRPLYPPPAPSSGITRWRSRLRHRATSSKVAGSIPDVVK
jgi:hypothetical protein